MKKFFAVVLFFSFFSFQALAGDPLELVGDRCAPGDVIFYGQTQNHKKEVLICQLNTNVFYQFGKVGQEPDLFLKMDSGTIKQLVTDNQSVSSEFLFIRNGDVVYQVGESTDLASNFTSGLVKVTKYGKGDLAEIMLDPDTVVNGIRVNFHN